MPSRIRPLSVHSCRCYQYDSAKSTAKVADSYCLVLLPLSSKICYSKCLKGSGLLCIPHLFFFSSLPTNEMEWKFRPRVQEAVDDFFAQAAFVKLQYPQRARLGAKMKRTRLIAAIFVVSAFARCLWCRRLFSCAATAPEKALDKFFTCGCR